MIFLILKCILASIVTIASLLYLIFNYPKWCRSKMCLIGKTAIITGGNRGLGYALAAEYASRGCRVIITCRSDSVKIREKLIEETGNTNIVTKHLDLTSFASVRKFADDINKTESRLDFLINNAGIGLSSTQYTEDGFHPITQTNHLGPFLLTHLLANILKKSAPSKIIFVNSALAYLHSVTMDSLKHAPEKLDIKSSLKLYENSKFCTLITSQILAKKLKSFNVTCNATQPGLVKTDIFKQFEMIGISSSRIDLFYNLFLNVVSRTPDEGIQSVLHATISKKYEHRTGEFLSDWTRFPMPWKSRDATLCSRIWEMSEEFVQLATAEKL